MIFHILANCLQYNWLLAWYCYLSIHLSVTKFILAIWFII